MRILAIVFLWAGTAWGQASQLHPLSVIEVLGGGPGLAETVSWDRGSLSLFISNARGSVSVIDLSDPSKPKPRFTIPAEGTVNSVAVSQELVAMAVESAV